MVCGYALMRLRSSHNERFRSLRRSASTNVPHTSKEVPLDLLPYTFFQAPMSQQPVSGVSDKRVTSNKHLGPVAETLKYTQPQRHIGQHSMQHVVGYILVCSG